MILKRIKVRTMKKKINKAHLGVIAFTVGFICAWSGLILYFICQAETMLGQTGLGIGIVGMLVMVLGLWIDRKINKGSR